MKKSIIKFLALFFATISLIFLSNQVGFTHGIGHYHPSKVPVPPIAESKSEKPIDTGWFDPKKYKPVDRNDQDRRIFSSLNTFGSDDEKGITRLSINLDGYKMRRIKNPTLKITEIGSDYLKDKPGYKGRKFIVGKPLKMTIDLKPYIEATPKDRSSIFVMFEVPKAGRIGRTKFEIPQIKKYLIITPAPRGLADTGSHSHHTH